MAPIWQGPTARSARRALARERGFVGWRGAPLPRLHAERQSMHDPNSLVRHSFVTAALATAPAGLVLALLVLFKTLDWHWAVLGAFAVLAGCYVVARMGLAHLEAAPRFIVALRPGEMPAPP